MPYGDGTGPMGRGPMTGKGFGRCARRRHGPFCWPAQSLTPEEEKEMLQKQKQAIEAKLKELE